MSSGKPAGIMTLASEIAANIPIYPTESVRRACSNDEDVHAFMVEWHLVFLSGAGIVVFLNEYNDLRLIDRVSDALNRLIDEERKTMWAGATILRHMVRIRGFGTLVKSFAWLILKPLLSKMRTRSYRWQAGRGWVHTTRSRHRSTSFIRAVRHKPATVAIAWAFRPWMNWRPIRPMCTGSLQH